MSPLTFFILLSNIPFVVFQEEAYLREAIKMSMEEQSEPGKPTGGASTAGVSQPGGGERDLLGFFDDTASAPPGVAG